MKRVHRFVMSETAVVRSVPLIRERGEDCLPLLVSGSPRAVRPAFRNPVTPDDVQVRPNETFDGMPESIPPFQHGAARLLSGG